MFQYMFAPMENTSDTALRTLCYKYGADLTFTEMTRLTALCRNNKSTLSKIKIKDNTPTIIQLAAISEPQLVKFLDSFVPENGFRGFNLNLGCPSPHIMKLGMGCAQIKRIEKTKKLISIIKNKGYDCSIKMRLGMNKFEQDKKAYLNLIKETNPDFFIVHARHGKQHYETPAKQSVYKECVETGKKIIANGDIVSIEQINELKKIGVKGVMIGRGAVRNPAIFNFLKGKKVPSVETLKKEYIELAKKYNTKEVYLENVLKRIGTQISTINENG